MPPPLSGEEAMSDVNVAEQRAGTWACVCVCASLYARVCECESDTVICSCDSSSIATRCVVVAHDLGTSRTGTRSSTARYVPSHRPAALFSRVVVLFVLQVNICTTHRSRTAPTWLICVHRLWLPRALLIHVCTVSGNFVFDSASLRACLMYSLFSGRHCWRNV